MTQPPLQPPSLFFRDSKTPPHGPSISQHTPTHAPTNRPMAKASTSISHPSQDFPSQNPCVSFNAATGRVRSTSPRWDLICSCKLGHQGVSSRARDGESRSNERCPDNLTCLTPSPAPPSLTPKLAPREQNTQPGLFWQPLPSSVMYSLACTYNNSKQNKTKQKENVFFLSANKGICCQCDTDSSGQKPFAIE